MKRERPSVLELSYFGLGEADLDTEFFTATRNGAIPKRMKLRAILASLEAIYGGTIGAEFAHVSDSDERLWLQDQFQAGQIGRATAWRSAAMCCGSSPVPRVWSAICIPSTWASGASHWKAASR